jgi:hypothetical protein
MTKSLVVGDVLLSDIERAALSAVWQPPGGMPFAVTLRADNPGEEDARCDGRRLYVLATVVPCKVTLNCVLRDAYYPLFVVVEAISSDVEGAPRILAIHRLRQDMQNVPYYDGSRVSIGQIGLEQVVLLGNGARCLPCTSWRPRWNREVAMWPSLDEVRMHFVGQFAAPAWEMSSWEKGGRECVEADAVAYLFTAKGQRGRDYLILKYGIDLLRRDYAKD